MSSNVNRLEMLSVIDDLHEKYQFTVQTAKVMGHVSTTYAILTAAPQLATWYGIHFSSTERSRTLP